LREIVAEFALRHQAKRDFYVELENDMRTARNDPYEVATVRFGRLFEAAVETWLSELSDLLPAIFDEAEGAH
jgi:hypothetical protein